MEQGSMRRRDLLKATTAAAAAAMQKNVTGYRYWSDRELDYRQSAKT
jgi:hypothetical protein